jgi:hypothetical protein
MPDILVRLVGRARAGPLGSDHLTEEGEGKNELMFEFHKKKLHNNFARSVPKRSEVRKNSLKEF